MIMTTLGELSVDGGNYGIAAPAVEYSSNLPTYLRITDICDDGTLDLSNCKSVDSSKAYKYILHENDIVFARTGNSTGRNYFYDRRDGEFVYAGFLIKFSLNPERVNPRYIKYYVQSQFYWDWIASYNTGSTRGNINAKTYESMPIVLPSRDVQDRIVKICDSISNKIRNSRLLNDYLIKLATIIFESALSEECNNLKFGEITTLEDSKRVPLNSRDREKRKGNYPYYGATSIMDYVDDYLFDGIRILLGEDGSVITDDGYPILQYVWGKYWVNNHAHIIKATSCYSLEMIYIALSRMGINHIVTGAVQKKISQKNLKDLSIEMPNPSISHNLEQLFNILRINSEECQHLIELRDALLPQFITGKIDISNID